ncbi:MAG: lipopolysaccharide heptosyltransferase [Rhodocyclaceae bacterium]|nr:lipopolysaccharide heptosyltransferase [Rhodocyclaceae bacterium]
MRILLVKTSSLGDVIHNLPVVSDLKRSLPEAEIDWCVEENFAAIPRLHPGVNQVLPVAVRRWRKALFHASTWKEMRAFRSGLRAKPYDLILDTQGLIKSALVARQARGPLLGYAAEAAREPLAARFYDRTFAIPKAAHAVERNRWLAAAAFGYPVDLPLDYGIAAPALAADWLPPEPYAVLLTATSRDDKLWEEARWTALGQALGERGIRCVLPAGSPAERQRAARLAATLPGAVAAPPLGLGQLAGLLAGARLTVGVDTGLTHLSAALRVPTVALYTATEPGLTGVLGTGFCRNLGGPGRSPEAGAVFDMLQAVLA